MHEFWREDSTVRDKTYIHCNINIYTTLIINILFVMFLLDNKLKGYIISVILVGFAGADPRFKKITPSGGKRENIWGISCEKSRFYAKNHIFFQF